MSLEFCLSRPRKRVFSRYVNKRAGLRLLTVATSFAIVLGFYIRNQISSESLKRFGTTFEFKESDLKVEFASARLSLADGAIPEVALELKDVRIFRAPRCQTNPAITASRIHLPFRWMALFKREAKFGIISGEDVFLDIDALKENCLATESDVVHSSSSVNANSSLDRPATDQDTESDWWKAEQLQAARDLLKGFRFNRAELYFEKRQKKVILENFFVTAHAGANEIGLTTQLSLPPELTYSESLPPLKLSITSSAKQAQMSVKAVMSEGSLLGQATLRPGLKRAMFIDASVSVANVPLSEMVPLLRKSGIASEKFKPRFLWINCRSEISGELQGLFIKSPLKVSDCSLSGDGTRVNLLSAIRKPDGTWEPLAFEIQSVRLNQIFETFGQKPPEGIEGELGVLSGLLEIRAKDDAKFSGQIGNSFPVFSVANRKIRQQVRSVQADFDVKGDRVSGFVKKIEFLENDVNGEIRFDFKRDGTDGEVAIKLDSFRPPEKLQGFLFGGSFSDLKGEIVAKIDSQPGQFSELKADLKVIDFKSPDIFSSMIRLQAIRPLKGQLIVTAELPSLLVFSKTPWLVSAKPLFFDHNFESPEMKIDDVYIQARLLDKGVTLWERAQAKLENGQISLKASGAETSESDLSGWITVDYPKVKNLKWKLGGKRQKPTFTEDATSVVSELRKKGVVDATALGLAR